jgi:nitroreductase
MADIAPDPDYSYYPGEWLEPFASRRIDCGRALYKALGIEKRDKDAKIRAWNNNYRFFGAPVGLLFFVNKTLNKGSWLDMGMFLQNVMLAASACGLATCPQASLADYPVIVRGLLGVDDQLALVCGMALGYPDLNAPVNQYRLERAPVDEFTRWHA